MKALSQWRTIAAVLTLMGLLLIALIICAQAPEAFGVQAYQATAWTVVLLSAVLAGKSAAQHLGAGGGVKGALVALMTNVKPGEPEPAATPASPAASVQP